MLTLKRLVNEQELNRIQSLYEHSIMYDKKIERFYHTFDHVKNTLDYINTIKMQTKEDLYAAKVALLYHDVVYEIHKQELFHNEINSIMEFEHACIHNMITVFNEPITCDSNFAKKVKTMIMDTGYFSSEENVHKITNWEVVAADVSVLGSVDHYFNYVASIFKEYKHLYDLGILVNKRLKFITNLLNRDFILPEYVFIDKQDYMSWTSQANKNLECEFNLLNSLK